MATSRREIREGHEHPVILPAPLAIEWEWQQLAKCRGHDTDVFFTGPTTEVEAKSICNSCPAITACLDHALSANEPYGVWGGATPSERIRMRWAHRKRNQTGA